MTIHVVQKGDTINSIADQYGVSVDRLILENGINDPDILVVGEALVILYPEITYTIREGDTLDGIADRYGISIFQLLRNNPYLSDREYIYPGETIVISYEGNKIRAIATNGYAFPYININVLRKTLPFLTYLSVYSYRVSAEGEINDINDTEIIRVAKEYGVAPVMMLLALSKSVEEEFNVIHSILSNQEIQERFFNNLLRILQTKGYIGVSIDTPYILPMDRSLYEEFVITLADRISKEGFKVFNTISIRIFQLLTGTIFMGLDLSELSKAVDGITLISYEFGYSEGIPPGTASMDTFRRFFEYSARVIPPEKINVGIPVIGYVWKYPYIPNVSQGMAISYDSAIKIAIENNAEIQYDEITNAAYFQYISGNDEYIVRFWDARSIDNFLKLISEFGLNGISIWNIMSWFPQMWLVINSQYDIEKVL
ncbi:LysM peptidoglycan-binding domain-containing protein [Anaerocolumna sp. MB42-C2]|uniref:LysM peptidoglycan-binding domain-containing protein n=1 Tax=Anaerocolumna sp. MB42-C2 TaxID=3070997 RepID=UPI0027DF3F20|nr:LysM peptidoglycan-binding domain-containing protein [Anaerocolumna sp. MB42-C2]WMJ87159.1 LysM peptidoglycan-binding domain-containing protein [Anaerocolumna sp. MB42-C2]